MAQKFRALRVFILQRVFKIELFVCYVGLNKFMPITALRRKAEWYSARCKQWINMVKYWNRLVNIYQSRLTSILFHWDYEKSVSNNNWCSELRVLLQHANMNQVFIEKATYNLDLFTE